MFCVTQRLRMSGVRTLFSLLLLVAAFCVAGCREQGDIRIRSLTFRGVEKIDQKALTDVRLECVRREHVRHRRRA